MGWTKAMAAGAEPRQDWRGVPMEADIDKALAVCREILNTPIEKVTERQWLLAKIREFGLAYNDWHLMESFANWKNASEFGLQQYPTEFVDFIIEIARHHPKDGIEIGVLRGASSYFIASVLQRNEPAFCYHMVDLHDNIVAFEQFSSFLNLQKHTPSTSIDFYGQVFDFVFIDADHSYNGVMTDYLNVGRFARSVVAFHDIHGHEYDNLSGGVVRAWREFKAANNRDMRILEFSHSPTPWMGIGLGVREPAFK